MTGKRSPTVTSLSCTLVKMRRCSSKLRETDCAWASISSTCSSNSSYTHIYIHAHMQLCVELGRARDTTQPGKGCMCVRWHARRR